ncbi:MAG: EamA/RhaT family transporter, partial [Burkholderiales bacterium]|nr:EamA/RhaT family transporter [Burkholderiales bacterium]
AHPAEAAIILVTETVFAALFGAWLLGDRLGPQGWMGCSLIGASVLLVQLLPMLKSRRAPLST